ncbi:MAG: Holliday junction resolvase RuvX [Bacteroidota bacterium]|nr:Holliday junction resolvase RuvX [Bacteroidota bacterium]
MPTGRILCIDYGKKRCGIAATDPLQLIVNGIDTVETSLLDEFLSEYIKREFVVKIVLGYPTHLDGNDTYLSKDVVILKNKMEQTYVGLDVVLVDEHFSSKKAKEIILISGAKRKDRRDKALIDKMSAVVILQQYLGHI